MKKYLPAVKFVCCLAALLLLAGCMTAQDYVKKGEKKESFYQSEKYYNKALELDPYDDELRKLIAAKYIPEIKANKGKERAELFEKALALDPDNLDIYYANAFALYVRDRDYVAAAKAFEELLERDPNFKAKDDLWATGSTFGLKNVDRIPIKNCSLHFLIGTSYFDATTNSKLSQAEKNGLATKALENLMAGMEIDISQGRNNTQEARTIYLLQIARTFEFIGDYETAISGYTGFLNDSSIKLDKTGISEKRQALYAKAGQQAPAVASNSPSGSSPASGQQRPQAVDMTGKADFVGEVGGVYRLRFSAGIPQHEVSVIVPPYIKSINVFTEGDLDTVIEYNETFYAAAELLNMFNPAAAIKKPSDAVFTDNQSSTNLNARVTFSVPQGGKFSLVIREKNGKAGTYTLAIQGTR